uniref:Uncharacterized protein n=1 Tax=Solanum tuberosum TaxID=4113 RepID=M1DM89_SOLTU
MQNGIFSRSLVDNRRDESFWRAETSSPNHLAVHLVSLPRLWYRALYVEVSVSFGEKHKVGKSTWRLSESLLIRLSSAPLTHFYTVTFGGDPFVHP